jgi:hypothetical protein
VTGADGEVRLSYPVTFEADYAHRRSRLTVFFRAILAIPLYLWLSLYGIAAFFAIVFAWCAIVATARYPEGLYRFVSGYLRVLTLATAYSALLCDRYPPFGPTPDDTYPVRMHFAGPLERYSRLKALLRGLLAIPIYVMRYAMNIVLELCSVAAWFVIIIAGQLPRGLFDTLMLVNSFVARSDGYLFLLAETYPPFQVEASRAPGYV